MPRPVTGGQREVHGSQIDVFAVEDSIEVCGAVSQSSQFFLEGHAFQQSDSIHHARLLFILLKHLCILVFVATAEHDLAAVVIEEMKLEMFWEIHRSATPSVEE